MLKTKKKIIVVSVSVVVILFMLLINIPFSFANNTNKEEFKEYLSDIKTRATGWYTSNDSILLDEDVNGDKITMLSDEIEIEYEKGLWLHGDALITYTNIQDYGYEIFESYVGVNKSAWDLSTQNTSFVFEFIIDGTTVLKTDTFTNKSDQEFISIDISNASVFQIKVDSLGVIGEEHAVMGDAVFKKTEATPYLYVFDLEFNQSDQVTKSNILDYAVAKDYLGNDISDKITYTTDFYEGGVGEFDLTYSVKCDEGYIASKTVKIIVTDEDYSKDLSLERMREPWADYMYHPRQTMDAQNQMAFDYILESILDFDIEDGVYVTNKPNLAYKFTINLQDQGIYVNSYYIKNMTSLLYDSEPRVWLLRKWTQEYTTKNGLVDTVTFYMTGAYLDADDEYNYTNQLILDNANTFLAEAKDDMTYQQKFYYTVNAYAKWIVYNDGGELIHSMGYGYGKCGGNAMGIVHLGHRLNIKSNYGDGNVSTVGFHGWSYQKMPEEDGWYFTDALWGRMLNTPNDSTYAPYYGSGIYTWFDENEYTYSADKKKYTYPSVWLELESEVIHLQKGEEYDFLSNVSTVDSIYDENVTLDDVVISIKYKDDSDAPYVSVGSCIDDILKAGDNLLRGEYVVTYSVDYNGFYITSDATLIVTDEKIEDLEYSALTGSYVANEGVYDGENEVYGAGFSLNNSSYVTLDVEGKDYQTLNFMYSAKSYVRTDSYAISYAKMYLQVYFDGELAYTSNVKTAFSSYDSPTLVIPSGTKEIKMANVSLGQASHGAVVNINFGYSDDLSNEYPEQTNLKWVIVKEATYEQDGEKHLISDCGCVVEVVKIDKLVYEDVVPDVNEDEEDNLGTGDDTLGNSDSSNSDSNNNAENDGNTNSNSNSNSNSTDDFFEEPENEEFDEESDSDEFDDSNPDDELEEDIFDYMVDDSSSLTDQVKTNIILNILIVSLIAIVSAFYCYMRKK